MESGSLEECADTGLDVQKIVCIYICMCMCIYIYIFVRYYANNRKINKHTYIYICIHMLTFVFTYASVQGRMQ